VNWHLPKSVRPKANVAEEKLKAALNKVNFFMALDTNDFDSLVSYHHHVGTYSNEVTQHISTARLKIARSTFDSKELEVFMERVDLANVKIQSIVNFATKANFVLDGEETTADLTEFIPQYVDKICTAFAGSDIKLSIENTAEEFDLKFKPIELFVVIDNLVHNSKKAEAKEVVFKLSSPDKNRFCLEVTDDGSAGLHTSISDDLRKGRDHN
jgi:signal transduction histidine kinase